MTITTPAFGLRAHALDALARARALAAQQQAEMTAQRRRQLEATLRTRLLRLFVIEDVPLNEDEERSFQPHWHALEALEPGVYVNETLFLHVNGCAPIVIIEGVVLGPAANGLVVGEWHDDEPPTDLLPIATIADLGLWCERRITEDEEDAADV